MDEKKIFIVNLSKGRMGETQRVTPRLDAHRQDLSRRDERVPMSRPREWRRLPRFYFYVDEFQSMMNEAFADILSESRKYKLALTLANQYIEQMEEKVRDAVFGNVGTLISFPRRARSMQSTLKTVFEPTFEAEDLVELGLGQIYLTLMIDGVGSSPFSAETIPPIEAPQHLIPERCRYAILESSTAGRARKWKSRSHKSRQSSFRRQRKIRSAGHPKEDLLRANSIRIPRATVAIGRRLSGARTSVAVSPRPNKNRILTNSAVRFARQ